MSCRVLVALLYIGAVDRVSAQIVAPRMQLVEEMRIDGTAADIVPIMAVAVHGNGRIAIVQPQDHQVRVYEPSGKLAFRFGRDGDGPGEFRDMTNVIGWTGDTIWLASPTDRRLTLIGPSGALVRAATIPSIVLPADAGEEPRRTPPIVRALFPDGSMLARVSSRGATTTDPLTGMQGDGTAHLARASSTGAVQKLVAELPRSIGSINITTADGMWGGAVPFVAQPLVAYASDGSRFGFVTTDITSKTGGTFGVTILRSTGDTVMSRAYSFTGFPIPQSAIDSVLTAFAANNARGRRPDAVTQQILSVIKGKSPPVYPFVRVFFIGIDNTVWIRQQTGVASSEWVCLDERGNPLFIILTPPGGITAASRTHVWSIPANADDIQSIVRYRITR